MWLSALLAASDARSSAAESSVVTGSPLAST